MFKNCIILPILLYQVTAYFTLPGKCPESVKLQEDFRLPEFFGKWYQVYHYSSDGLQLNNCSTIDLLTSNTGIQVNQTRVDRGLFQRYSIGRLDLPFHDDDSSKLNITFTDMNAPRRLSKRSYPFRVLATNYNYYAALYTCSYSPLINKHYIYVWLLSRNKILNEVSKELATTAIKKGLGIGPRTLVKDDLSEERCTPKYYEDKVVEPVTFRFPVPI